MIHDADKRERSTRLETEPKIGIRHVDLLKLYQRVVGEGGYDLCSDTKSKPLLWRKFAEEFIGKNQDKAVTQTRKDKFNLIKNSQGYYINSVGNHGVCFIAHILARKIMRKCKENEVPKFWFP